MARVIPSGTVTACFPIFSILGNSSMADGGGRSALMWRRVSLELVEQLIARRVACGFTQGDIDHLCGFQESYCSHLERPWVEHGRSLTARALDRLASVEGVEIRVVPLLAAAAAADAAWDRGPLPKLNGAGANGRERLAPEVAEAICRAAAERFGLPALAGAAVNVSRIAKLPLPPPVEMRARCEEIVKPRPRLAPPRLENRRKAKKRRGAPGAVPDDLSRRGLRILEGDDE
jgi:hypothetical protein